VVDRVTSHSGNSTVGVDDVDDGSVCADVVGVDGVEDGSGDVDNVCIDADVLVLSCGRLIVGDGAIGVVGLGMHDGVAGFNVLQACTISRSRMSFNPVKLLMKK